MGEPHLPGRMGISERMEMHLMKQAGISGRAECARPGLPSIFSWTKRSVIPPKASLTQCEQPGCSTWRWEERIVLGCSTWKVGNTWKAVGVVGPVQGAAA